MKNQCRMKNRLYGIGLLLFGKAREMKKTLFPLSLLLALLLSVSGCPSTGGGDSTSSGDGGGSPQQVAMPQFGPGGGTKASLASVKVTSATSGAAIRYTLDGTTPNKTTGTVYASPVNIVSSSTLKAVAYKTAMTDSTVASATYTIVPKIAGFNFSLGQSRFWQYGWTKTVYTYALGSSPTTVTTTGNGTVTLGAPRTIQGVTAYPIILGGTFPQGYSPTWKYIAISSSRILGSNDGNGLADIFNAWTGANAGGGFFYQFNSTMSGAYASGMSTTYYVNSQTYALGQFSETGGGTYYPGIGTIYTGEPSTSSNTVEYFAPGVGPVGFKYSYGYVATDFMTSTTEEMGLTASSFTTP